jgi:hypothetical protein
MSLQAFRSGTVAALRQEMDSEADAEYIQKRAQETIDSFLGGKDIDIKDKAAVKRQLKLTSEEVIQLKCLGRRRFLTICQTCFKNQENGHGGHGF